MRTRATPHTVYVGHQALRPDALSHRDATLGLPLAETRDALGVAVLARSRLRAPPTWSLLSHGFGLSVRGDLQLRHVSAPHSAQLLEEGVVVDLDPLVEDAAFIVVAEDVGQLEHDVLPIRGQRTDR